jgi:hypothetical protein
VIPRRELLPHSYQRFKFLCRSPASGNDGEAGMLNDNGNMDMDIGGEGVSSSGGGSDAQMDVEVTGSPQPDTPPVST